MRATAVTTSGAHPFDTTAKNTKHHFYNMIKNFKNIDGVAPFRSKASEAQTEVDALRMDASSAMQDSKLLAAGAEAHQSKSDEALLRAGETGDGLLYNVALCGAPLLRDLCRRLPPAR